MYYYQLWVSATWIPQKQLLKVFEILKWAHWLILLDSVTYILVIENTNIVQFLCEIK